MTTIITDDELAGDLIAVDGAHVLVSATGTQNSLKIVRWDLESGERLERPVARASRIVSQGSSRPTDALSPVLVGDAVWIGQPDASATTSTGTKISTATNLVPLDTATLEQGPPVPLPDQGVVEQLASAGDHVVVLYRTAPTRSPGSMVVDVERSRWRLQTVAADGTLGQPVDLGGYGNSNAVVDDADPRFRTAAIAASPDGETLIALLGNEIRNYDPDSLAEIARQEQLGAVEAGDLLSAIVGDDVMVLETENADLLLDLPSLEVLGPVEVAVQEILGRLGVSISSQPMQPTTSFAFTAVSTDDGTGAAPFEVVADCTCSLRGTAQSDDTVWAIADHAIVGVETSTVMRKDAE